MTAGSSHSSVWRALDAWAEALKPWQRAVLAMAIKSGKLSDTEIDEAHKLFCEEAGLSEARSGSSATATESIGRPADALAQQLRLARIDGLNGVNAIPDSAALTFGPALTIIYGPNGAGKSGFARLIANGCFSRYKPTILGNVYEESSLQSPRAMFHITLDGEAEDPIAVSEGVKHPDLLRIAFFDVTVARKHVSETAPFDFKPAGFDVFPEMARVYSQLAAKLDADTRAHTRDTSFSHSFIGPATEVSKAVAGINARTDIRQLETVGTYGTPEAARLQALDQQLIALRASSPKDVLGNLNQARSDIVELQRKIVAFKLLCDQANLEHFSGVARAAKETADAATALGSDHFKRPFFSAVGTPEWDAFAKAAHALARREGATYPTEEDRCLMCERPYDPASRQHVDALLKFVEGDAQRASADAAAKLHREIDIVQAVDVNVFGEGSRVRDHVRRINPEAEALLASFAESISLKKEKVVSSLRNRQPQMDALELDQALASLSTLTIQIDEDVARLEKPDQESALASLEVERQALRHREVLSKLLPAIRTHIADAKWCALAARAKPSLNPRPITDKEKELFGQLIGDSYRSHLATECGHLHCLMPIELQTAGQKGTTVRSLAIKGGHPPDQILSEGEQKAVALADFLTEVALNPTNAGIVLDDPVTSQDHERKKLISKRLVKEAAIRQVIIFTHDLPFLNDIVVRAEDAGVDVQKHWIQRQDGKPGLIALDDAPTTSKSYDTTERASQRLKEARSLIGSAQQDAIIKGMEALRRTIEETVAKKLLKGVVPRWEDRVIVTALSKVNWDNALIDELIEMYEDLSTYIEAHSHTDEARGAPPETSDLEERIARLDGFIKRAKAERPKAANSHKQLVS
jgi:hypothetical protein